jgi:hypothetical protein
MPGTGHQFGNVLQMALEVRRDGRVDDKLKAEIASEALQKKF